MAGFGTAAERRDQVVRLIAAKGPLQPQAIAKELRIPPRTVREDVRKLVAEGRIEPTGSNPQDPKLRYRLKPA